jgi:hypothetical protein
MLIILMLAPVGLLLTSSKWGWHIAVLAIPAALLTLLLIQFGKHSEDWSRPRFVVILPVIALLAGVSLAQVGSWGSLDQSVITWKRFAERVAGPDTQWWWLAAIVILVAVGAALDQRPIEREKPRAIGASIAIFGLLLPSAASGAWIFADTYLTKPNDGLGWTIFGQNIKELAGHDSGECGSLGNTPDFTTDVTPLVAAPDSGNRQLLMRPASTESLGFDGVEGWQTVPGNRSAISTRSYLVPDSHNATDTYALWFNFTENDSDVDATIKIVASKAGNLTVVRKLGVGRSPESWMWSKIEFALPRDSESVRVVVNTATQSALVVTQPVVDIRDTGAKVLEAGSVFVAPSTLPSIPCAILPSAAEGLFPATPFIVLERETRNFLLLYFPYQRLYITELNEMRSGHPGIGKVSYDQAGSLTSTVAVTSMTEDRLLDSTRR